MFGMQKQSINELMEYRNEAWRDARYNWRHKASEEIKMENKWAKI